MFSNAKKQCARRDTLVAHAKANVDVAVKLVAVASQITSINVIIIDMLDPVVIALVWVQFFNFLL